ncbi:MAG: formyltransferase family protein [Ardenticatenaceae bacterium]|nr:formyltransferase family protein [Ardenticatenaceae bacterium]HBY99453.1 phosphoribosylglycinamide formyltransferase [Chloroflexota bacterium]
MDEYTRKIRLVLLIAGSGTTMQAILDACRLERLNAQVVAVFSHEPYEYGLLRAEREGVAAFLHDLSNYRFEGRSQHEYDTDLAERVAAIHPDYVVVAEWKLPLGSAFLEHFPNRVIHLHSGLPGQFPLFDPYGQNPVSRAFDAYNNGLIRETGVNLHILRDAAASGPVLAQERVPIYEYDTLLDLEDRFIRAAQDSLINGLRLLIATGEREYNQHWWDRG